MAVYDPEVDIRDREEKAGADSGGAPANTDTSRDAVRDSEKSAGQSGGLPNLGGAGVAGLGIPLAGGFGSALKTLGRFLWKNNRRKAATIGSGSSAMVVLALIWVTMAFKMIGDIDYGKR